MIGLIDPDAKPFLIGLPEAGLKICPGWGGTNLLPARIDPEQAIIMTAIGRAMKSDQADEMGLFDVTVSSRDELIGAARAWVGAQDGPDREGSPSRCIDGSNRDDIEIAMNAAAQQIESELHTDAVLDAVGVGVESGWEDAIARERAHLVKLRHTEPAQDAINAFFNKGK